MKSRAFGSDRVLGLAPVIDLLNHRQGAPKPRPWSPEPVGDQEAKNGEPPAEEDVLWFVTSMLQDQLLPLQAGQELYITYIARSCSPFTSLLNFGFVPPELNQRN